MDDRSNDIETFRNELAAFPKVSIGRAASEILQQIKAEKGLCTLQPSGPQSNLFLSDTSKS
jgi:hypothetical protein